MTKIYKRRNYVRNPSGKKENNEKIDVQSLKPQKIKIKLSRET